MLLAHRADRLNVIRALAAPAILFAPFFIGFPFVGPVACFILVFLLIGETNYILHLHIHHPFARHKWLNLVLDLAMGMATGFSASNWRIQHRFGHHCGRDVPFRASARAMERYSPQGAIAYSLLSIAPTFWRPLAESWQKGLRGMCQPIDYRWALAEQGLLIAFVLGLLAWQPAMVLLYLLPWYLLIAAITRYVDYLNHYGCDERSPDPFSRANNCLSPTFNRGCSNFGYHTAHHIDPNAHWTELPRIHARIAHRIPDKHLKQFSWSCLLFPYHCLLALRGRM